MSTDGFTQTLARWAADMPLIESSAAVTIGKQAITDTIGCMLAGTSDDATRRVLIAATSLGSGNARVVGHTQRLAPGAAAMVNATAAHVYDYDDNFFPAAAHASAVLLPSLLALAESEDLTGAQLLDAYVVGLEVMGRIGEGVNMLHYQLGWHATSTLGSIGAAAACARLLSLDGAQMSDAISLGMSLASGTKNQFGTMAKPLHAGFAAEQGLRAAMLAKHGVNATSEPLDGTFGWRAMFAADSLGFDESMSKIGRPLAIEEYGLMTKPHPCCASVHCTVDAIIGLMSEHDLNAADIERVQTFVPKITVANLPFPEPSDEREARFSMHYGVGLAIEHGALRLRDFRSGGFGNPAVVAWAPRVEMVEDESVAENALGANVIEPARVVLHLGDGRVLDRTQRYAKGVLQNPMSTAERNTKLRDCTAESLSDEQLSELIARLDQLATTPVAEVMAFLARTS